MRFKLGSNVTWKPPYQVDINSRVKPGRNEVEACVTVPPPNRIIEDLRLPPEKRLLEADNWTNYTAASPLRTLGLLGPAVIRPVGKVRPV